MRGEYRDAKSRPDGLVVELDGRPGQNSREAAGRDADRHLDDLATSRVTLRLRFRFRQMFATPCRTAPRVAAVLRGRGRAGVPRRYLKAAGWRRERENIRRAWCGEVLALMLRLR